MTEGDYKPEAKCKYAIECILYNSNVLSLEAELRMCGRGYDVDESYVPQVPAPKEFRPIQGYQGSDPGQVCGVYERTKKFEVLMDVSDKVHDIVEILERNSVW